MTLFEFIYLPGELQKIAFPLLDWISSMNTQLVSRSHFTTVEPSRRSALNPRGGLFKNDSSSITSITNREMVFLFLTSWGQNEWSSSWAHESPFALVCLVGVEPVYESAGIKRAW